MANCFRNIFGLLAFWVPKKKVWPTEDRLLSYVQIIFVNDVSQQAYSENAVEKPYFYALFWQKYDK